MCDDGIALGTSKDRRKFTVRAGIEKAENFPRSENARKQTADVIKAKRPTPTHSWIPLFKDSRPPLTLTKQDGGI